MNIRDRADANYFHAFRVLARSGKGAVSESGGLLAASSGLPVAFLNIAFVTRRLESPEDQLSSAAAFFDSRGEPFIVRIREGLDPASEAACERLGMPYSDSVPGMASTAMIAPHPPAGLDIRLINDAAALADFHAVAAVGFGMPLEIIAAYVPAQTLAEPEMESYVGYVDGCPAASSTMVYSGRVAGIFNVATVPEFRKRGFGEALTWHGITRGAGFGCDMAALQASDMGRPIYERMGFRLVSPYKTFHRPGV